MSNRLLFANNAASELRLAISAGDTVLQVADGSRFPIPTTGQQFQATIEDRRTGAREIVACLNRGGNALTVLRGQEGTSPQAFTAGAIVANRVTAYTLDYMLDQLNTFGGLYLGAHALAPVADNAGEPLRPGMIYYNELTGGIYVYDPLVGWKILVQPAPSSQRSYIYILASSNAVITGPDRDGIPLEFTDNDLLAVYVNGTRILPATDYNRSGGNTINIAATLPPGTTVEVVRIAIVYRDFITTAAEVDTTLWSFDGAQTRFPLVDTEGLTLTPANAANCMLSLDGTMQRPEGDFTIEGSEVVFAEPPRTDAAAWMTVGLPIASESGATYAPLNSPAFTGTPTGPTAAAGTNTTQLATTAFVSGAFGDKAPLASPAFTGNPTAPTQASNDNSTRLATTAFVQTAVGTRAAANNAALTGVPTAPTAAADTNTTQIATTAYVQGELADRAPLASPSFSGTPAVPTAAPGTNTTQAASTAFVQAAVATGGGAYAPLNSPPLTGIPTAPTAPADTNTTQIATTAYVQGEVAGLAPLASPAFSGAPTAPTAAADTNTTQIATTAYVQGELADRAPLASPALTGTPTAPTAAADTNSTQVATTAYVQGEIADRAPLASPALTGNPTATTQATTDSSTRLATTSFVHALVDRTNEAAKAANYTVAAADSGSVHTCTAALTVTIPAAATLGANFYLEIFHGGASGTVTLDGPGGTNVTLAVREGALIVTRNGVLYASKYAAMTLV